LEASKFKANPKKKNTSLKIYYGSSLPNAHIGTQKDHLVQQLQMISLNRKWIFGKLEHIPVLN